MKKATCFFLAICLYSMMANSQRPAIDAIFLGSKFEPAVGNKIQLTNEVKELLSPYYPGVPLASINQARLDANPILAGIFVDLGAMAADRSKLSNVFGAIGNLNVTNFADGLAKFLVERSKEELNVAFFRKLQEFLKEYPEVKIVFPATIKVIDNVKSYSYSAMLPALRAAFQKDFISLCDNLIDLRETSNYENYGTNATIKARADLIVGFLTTTLGGRSIIAALIIANGITKGTNVADIISNVANDKLCTDYPNDNFSNSIKFINLLSQSLRSNEEGRVWITSKEVRELVRDNASLKIYLGLIYLIDQNYSHNVKFTFPAGTLTLQTTLVNIMNALATAGGTKFKETLTAAGDMASEVSDNAENILNTKKQGEQSAIVLYAEYASSISSFLKFAAEFLSRNTAIEPQLSHLTVPILEFTAIIDDAVDCYYDIKSQNYGSLVLHSASLLSKLIGTNFDPYKEDYVKYATFMAAIVQAQNSDEVKEAIEAAVLPVGSSSIKRETNVNIALNAFIGPFAGAEYMPKLKDNEWAFVTGITAPVGVAFSWGNKKSRDTRTRKNKVVPVGGKSFTLFVPLIDVGALATFRINDEKTEVAAEVQLKNIISPGLYFYYGFGKCPISFGIGGQVGPQLRKVTTQDVNIDKNVYVRFGASIVVDIPLLNFYINN